MVLYQFAINVLKVILWFKLIFHTQQVPPLNKDIHQPQEVFVFHYLPTVYPVKQLQLQQQLVLAPNVYQDMASFGTQPLMHKPANLAI